MLYFVEYKEHGADVVCRVGETFESKSEAVSLAKELARMKFAHTRNSEPAYDYVEVFEAESYEHYYAEDYESVYKYEK